MRMFLKILFLIALWQVVDSRRKTHPIRSPEETNYGVWQDWQWCPEDTYVAAAQVKAEGDQRGGDDTGLNAIALYCLPMNWQSIHYDHRIQSGEGAYGEWGSTKFCPKGQVLIGFALRSEPDQRGKDDVAADNFRGYCGHPFGPRSRAAYVEGDTRTWGHWTADQWCPDDYAVCGIQTQIEGPVGGGDDTSLNNVQLDCCKVEEVKCKVGYQMVTVETFDNTRGAGEMQVTYRVKTSFTQTRSESRSLSNTERQVVGSRISSTVGSDGLLSSSITAEISESQESESTTSLTTLIEETIQEEKEKSVTITIPPYKRAVVKQLFLTCDAYRMGVAATIVHQ